MDFVQKFKVFSIVFSFAVLLGACNEDDNVNDVEKVPELSFVESSLPETINDQGGTFSLEVKWAYTEWEVTSELVEGEAFISNISPSIGGNTKKAETTTMVIFAYNSNENPSENKQKIILNSLTNDISQEITLTQEGALVQSTVVNVDPAVTYQTISGFGGANMIWGTDYLNSSELDMALGTGEDELGLSIYRVRLSSSKNDWAGLVNSVKGANERGALVLASPWSPPAKWKSNNSTDGGGYLLKEYYDDFANYINEFIQYMDENGAKIDVVSIQNEPDWEVSYEGCEYTSAQMFDFVKNYAGVITGAKVLAAESMNFKHSYTDDILNDATAAQNLDIVGGHLYGGGMGSYSLAEEKNKEIWMTEHLLNLNSGQVPSNWTASTDPEVIWGETMDMVEEVHSSMTSNWNAYIWWYVRRYYSFLGDGNNGTQRGEILKRGYAFSQFSKFVRPGYQRIKAETEGVSTLKMTAYAGDGKTVIVVINPSEYSSKNIEIPVSSSSASAVAYTTSIEDDRRKTENILSDGKVVVNLPTESITTIVIEN